MRRTLCLSLLLSLAACSSECTSPTPSEVPATPVEAKNTAFDVRAHEEAFARLRPLATRVFELADPWTAAELGRAPWRLPSDSDAARAELGTTLDAAWREASTIDATKLEFADAFVLRFIRVGLQRQRDVERMNPAATSPLHVLHLLRRVIATVEREGDAPSSGLIEALDELTPILDRAPSELVAVSAAELEAAIDTALGLATTVGAHATARPQPLRGALSRVQAALERLAGAYQGLQRELPEQPTTTWDQRFSRRGARALGRLPDRIGAHAFARRLDVEEAIGLDARELVRALEATFDRLDGLAKRVEHDPSERRPVTRERCIAATRKVVEWLQQRLPSITDADVDCSRLAGVVPTAADALLRDTIVSELARHWRHEQQVRVDPAMAVVTGRIAPASHAVVMRVVVHEGRDDHHALGLALEDARTAACRAVTASWIHGELGADAPLHAVLQQRCPSRSVDAWIRDALGRPREAMDGLGVIVLAADPAAAVTLDRYAWAPFGLISEMSAPAVREATPSAVLEHQPIPAQQDARP